VVKYTSITKRGHPMSERIVIIDGYIDEPAQFGVPPYISPLCRYAYGCYVYYGVHPEYYTIDQIRNNDLWEHLNTFDHLVLIGGVSVPGKYIGGNPLKYKELVKISLVAPKPLKIYKGPYTLGYTSEGGRDALIIENLNKLYDCPVTGNLETFLFHLLRGDLPEESISSNGEVLKLIAPLGAKLIEKHPNFPNLICEIEVSKGCERSTHCSFCTEPLLYGQYTERPPEDILDEIEALTQHGARYFRLGRAANILAYGYSIHDTQCEYLEKLYSGIRKLCPSLSMLHTDNANPGFIQQFPFISEKGIEIISTYNTPGDCLSFGVESFDENVIKHNNLSIEPEAIIEACSTVNHIGGFLKEGIPALLPGINLLFGLISETPNTYDINFDYLKRLLDRKILLRRINIRKAMVFPDTPLYYYSKKKKLKTYPKEFRKFKEKVREEIDKPMLKMVFPYGTLIKDVIIEYNKGNISFGRKLGTYAILIGIRQKIQPLSIVNVRITDHGYRSITGVLDNG